MSLDQLMVSDTISFDHWWGILLAFRMLSLLGSQVPSALMISLHHHIIPLLSQSIHLWPVLRQSSLLGFGESLLLVLKGDGHIDNHELFIALVLYDHVHTQLASADWDVMVHSYYPDTYQDGLHQLVLYSTVSQLP